MTKARLLLVLQLFVCMSFSILFISCDDDEDEEEGGSPLSITSITPTTARVGETVTIAGTGFSPDRPSNTVTFTGNASATVVTASATTLEVTVPQGAANGTISVTVNGKTVTSTQQFTLNNTVPAPAITSLAPANGFVGSEVMITGERFSNDSQALTVLFNETEAEIISSSTTQIKVTVPAGLSEGQTLVTVKRDNLTSNTSTFVVDPLPTAVKVTYWSSTDQSTINRGTITNEGVEIEVLYDFEDGVDGPLGVAIDTVNDVIFWLNQYTGQIMKAPTNGDGPVEVIFDAESNGTGLSVDVAYDYQSNAIFFTDNVEGVGYIKKGNIDSRVVENVYSLAEGTAPHSIKLLVANSKLYWSDNTLDEVYEGALDGSATPKLLFASADGLISPNGIAVDPANNKIYIVDNTDPGATSADAIYMGGLDGAGALTRIVQAGDDLDNATDIEIDVANGFIFWINYAEDGNIKRAKLDGSTVETLFSGINSGAFFDLDIR